MNNPRKRVMRATCALLMACIAVLMAQTASAEEMTTAPGFAAFDPPGFTMQDDRTDDSSENAPPEAVEPDRFYHWQGNLTAFLEEIMVIAGFDHDDAYKQAKRIRGLMNPKFDWKTSDAERIVRFALDTIGRASGQTEVESAVEQLEARHGRLGLGHDVEPSGVSTTKPRVPINSQPYYQWWGNLTVFVESVFHEMGYDPDTAYHMAKTTLVMMGLENRDTHLYQETDWRAADPHAFLMKVLATAGFGSLESGIRSALSLTELGVRGWQMPEPAPKAAQLDTCVVRKVKIVWCDGNGDQHTHTGYMSATKWSALAACPASSTCTYPEVPWYELTHNGACIDTLPLSPVCVWIKEIDGGPSERDCDDIDITLNCFAETNPTVNCSQIETTCGGYYLPPDDDCPDCQ